VHGHERHGRGSGRQRETHRRQSARTGTQPSTSQPRWRTSKVISKSMKYSRPRAGSFSERFFTDAGGRQMFAGLQPLCLCPELISQLCDGQTEETYASPSLYRTSY
jgi:hypothetical protein